MKGKAGSTGGGKAKGRPALTYESPKKIAAKRGAEGPKKSSPRPKAALTYNAPRTTERSRMANQRAKKKSR